MSNRGKKLPGEVLTPEEVARLIKACGRSASGVRNAAIVATLFGAGLRASEALSLKPSDLDLENGLVRIRHGKGGKARTVAIDPAAQAYLERWLARRERLGLNGKHPLFPTISKPSPGKPLDTSYLRQVLPRVARRSGIDRRVHPHALRHSLASALSHEGKSVRLISDQLGHSSISTTDRYLRRFAPAELAREVRDRARI